MGFSFLLNKDINEKNIVPCYFLYGEEMFLAQQFVENVKTTLIPPEDEYFHIEKFRLEDSTWMDVFDSARMAPFFLTSWRILVIEISNDKKGALTQGEEKIFKDYFNSPPAQTVIILLLPGKIGKTNAIFRMISSLPSGLVCAKELKPLRDYQVMEWVGRKLDSLNKRATLEAKNRLLELTGNDLGRINNEIEKIVTFVDKKNPIELDDVNQVSGWVKSFAEYELANALERADFDQSLIVLNELLRKEKAKPEFIMGAITKFFRDLLLAKLWLKDKKERKAIFKELKPQIQEKFGNFYSQRFRAFFSLLDRLSMTDLSDYLKELQEIDLKIKTSAPSPQILMERFLFKYCKKQSKLKGKF